MRRRSSLKKKTESWQIIYIDLMTNIMIFFVVMPIYMIAEKAADAILRDAS